MVGWGDQESLNVADQVIEGIRESLGEPMLVAAAPYKLAVDAILDIAHQDATRTGMDLELALEAIVAEVGKQARERLRPAKQQLEEGIEITYRVARERAEEGYFEGFIQGTPYCRVRNIHGASRVVPRRVVRILRQR